MSGPATAARRSFEDLLEVAGDPDTLYCLQPFCAPHLGDKSADSIVLGTISAICIALI